MTNKAIKAAIKRFENAATVPTLTSVTLAAYYAALKNLHKEIDIEISKSYRRGQRSKR